MNMDKCVVFQSRFRSYNITLKRSVLARDEKGRGVYDDINVQFDNFMAVIPDTEENAEKIALMRKRAGTDFVEVDVAKKKAEHHAQQNELASLKARVKELEAQVGAAPAAVSARTVVDTPAPVPPKLDPPRPGRPRKEN